MSQTKRLQTNFSAGEFSDLIEGRPDLAKYYNGARKIENFLLYAEGGAFRAPGTRFVVEVSDSTKTHLLVPFEFNITQAYMLLHGHQLIWFFKNNARIDSGGNPVQVTTPYLSTELKDLQYRQSADVLFETHPNYEIRKLSRISDINWAFALFAANPPPSFEADTDISGGTATLTPAATTGTGVTFTASSAVFLATETSLVGRQIIFGASKAVITGFTDTTHVVADIIDAFPNINPISAGSWLLRNSPQTTLDVDKKEPVGASVSLAFGAAALRDADVGKFLKIYGGLIKIKSRSSDIAGTGTILSVLSKATTADPAPAPAGSWTMEVASWSNARGWPQALEFHQGRFFVAGTTSQRTTLWGSSSDDFVNFAIGSLADNAIEYTIAARRVNVIEWLISLGHLFIGDAENEHTAKGQGVDAPLGGDEIPFIRDQSAIGSQHVQPVVAQSAILMLQRFKQKVYELSYSLEADTYTPKNRTLLARQIGSAKFSQHAPAYAQEPNSIVYFLLDNGELGCLTYNRDEDVLAWSRIVTDGAFESVAVIPHPDGDRHQVWVVVHRTINGATKRYVEYFDDKPSEMSGRLWQELHTHSAKVGTILAGATTITGLSHLEAKSVDVIIGNSYVGQKVVTGGQITGLEAPAADTTYEVGLHYDSTIQTARVAIPQATTEGLKRHWTQVFVRLKDSIGGKINGEQLKPTEPRLFSGLQQANPTDWDFDGYLTIVQDQPYPFQVLGVAGQVDFADEMGGQK